MQVSDAVANAMIDAAEVAAGTGVLLRFYTGAMPSLCSGAATGTKVAEMTLPSDWLTNASGRSKAKNGTWAGLGTGNGYAAYYRIYDSTGTTCHMQGLISENWQASKVYGVGQQVNLGGNIYRATAGGTSAGSGGPTGTGSGITDGTVTWAYVAPSAGEMVLDNTNIAAGQAVAESTFTFSFPALG